MTVFAINDALAGLKVLSWRGIRVPYASVSTDGGHDLAVHAKPGRDGARLEDMGEPALAISVRCLLRNGIQLDPTIQNGEPLFPGVADRFLRALRDGSTGELVHPRYGTLQAKVRSWRESIASGVRDGADYDVTWVEHTPDDAVLGAESPSATAAAEAVILDTNLALLRAKGAAFNAAIAGTNPPASFADLIRSVQASVDMTAVIAKRGAGSLDRIRYQVGNLMAALDRLGDVSTNAARQAGERLTWALNALSGAQDRAARRVGTFTIPTGVPWTVARLSSRLTTSPSDLYRLNPGLAGLVSVREGTTVRYYL